MLKHGDKVTAINFDGVPQKCIVQEFTPPESIDGSNPDLCAIGWRCFAGDHSECIDTTTVSMHPNGAPNPRHQWCAFLDRAELGIHYALGWEGPEVDALKASAALSAA